jgi:7-carboxy-7-deazaguanine synthase
VAVLITEIFASIQGEGQRAGLPTTFVRLARCPYRCTWCDSTYTFGGGTAMTEDEVLDRVRSLGQQPNVCITGGEPLVQRRAVRGLIDRLLADFAWIRSVEVETSGGLAIWPAHDGRLYWDLDVKCPGSGMVRHFVPENLHYLRTGDEIKLVIVDRADFDFASGFVRDHLAGTPAGIFFQPAWGHLDPAQLVAWLNAEPIAGARVSLQLHKFIWGPETTGV